MAPAQLAVIRKKYYKCNMALSSTMTTFRYQPHPKDSASTQRRWWVASTKARESALKHCFLILGFWLRLDTTSLFAYIHVGQCSRCRVYTMSCVHNVTCSLFSRVHDVLCTQYRVYMMSRIHDVVLSIIKFMNHKYCVRFKYLQGNMQFCSYF